MHSSSSSRSFFNPALRQSRLSTSLVYLPVTRAGAPSSLRQLAYNDGSALLGPDGDPDGWQVLPPVRITGTIFNTRETQIFCTVRTRLTFLLRSHLTHIVLSSHLPNRYVHLWFIGAACEDISSHQLPLGHHCLSFSLLPVPTNKHSTFSRHHRPRECVFFAYVL